MKILTDLREKVETDMVPDNAPINVKLQGWGGGGGENPRKFDIVKLSEGRGVLTSKMVCWVRSLSGNMGNLTSTRFRGVGNLTLACQKMSKSTGSAPPPLPPRHPGA